MTAVRCTVTAIAAPPELQLERGLAGGTMPPGRRSVLPFTLSGRDRGGWIFLSDSLVRIWWSTGFANLTLNLRVFDDSLVGRAKSSNDVFPQPDRSASAVATRIECKPRKP